MVNTNCNMRVKGTYSNELLPFLVEVEDLVQRKKTQCVKEM